jgi:hypothetical protein
MAALVAPATGRERRIGALMVLVENDPEAPVRVAVFRRRLREIGWSEAATSILVWRLLSHGPNGADIWEPPGPRSQRRIGLLRNRRAPAQRPSVIPEMAEGWRP